MKGKSLSFIALGLSASLFSPAAQSATFFPILPQVLLTGNMNEYSNGQASALIPVWGSRKGFVFLGGGGRYGGSQGWYGSVGLGTRAIWHHQIWSAYVYGDRDDTAQGGLFWVVNPGVQWMNRSWDVTMNGYFPTNKQRAIPGLFWGDQLGMSQYVHFVGHVELDAQFRQFENVGDGGDGQVGYTFKHLHHLRFYLGGYYHSLNRAGHVNGGQIGMQLPLRHRLSVELSNSYDNIQRDVITFSLKYRLGGLPDDYSDDAPLANRIMSPIPRHLGTLAMGSGIFSRNHLQRATDIGGGTVNDGEGGGGEVIPIPDGEGVERQHIWFFSANGVPFDPAKGLSQCTSTSPCSVNSSNFSQALVDQLNTLDPGTNFFLTGVNGPIVIGSNALQANSDGVDSDNEQLTLRNGQSIFGRNSDYTLQAENLDRPVFIGRINLEGNNAVDSTIVLGNYDQYTTSQTIGIEASGASNITIHNTAVAFYYGGDGTSGAVNGGSATGIDLRNVTNADLDGVQVVNIDGGYGADGANNFTNGGTGGTGGKGGDATGINLSGARGTVTLKDIDVDSVSAGYGGRGGESYIEVPPGSEATANNYTSTGGVGGDGGNATGIDLSNVSGATFSGTNNVSAIFGGGSDGGFADITATPEAGAGQVEADNNQSIGGAAGTAGNAVGVNASGSSNVAVNNLTVNNVMGGDSQGGGATNALTALATANGVSVQANNNTAVGGDAGQGGDGIAINANNTSNFSMRSSRLDNISGGGSTGGQADTLPYAFQATDAQAMSDGNEATGGNAGNGGNAIAVDAQSAQNITVSNNIIEFLTAGSSQGGSASVNPRAEATNNDNVPGNSITADNNVGTGGVAARGGNAIAINVPNANGVVASDNTISDLTGGASYGGTAFMDMFAANSDVVGGGVNPQIAGNTSTGGIADEGGFVEGINAADASNITVNNNSFTRLIGGGSQGGAADIYASADYYPDGSAPTITATNEGTGGDGSQAGNVTGINLTGATGVTTPLLNTFTDLLGGESLGGDVTAQGFINGNPGGDISFSNGLRGVDGVAVNEQS